MKAATDLEGLRIDWRFKGFPPHSDPLPIESIAGQGWDALGGDLLFPLALIKRSALDHNIRLMADYCRRVGVSFAPHAKTPIAPQVVSAQLAAGAWGITVATFHQCRVMRRFGVSRLFLANQLLERRALHWLVEEMDRDPDFEFFCLVDSLAGVEVMSEQLTKLPSASRIKVLVEVGSKNGRAGVRSVDEGVEVAAAVNRSDRLALIGVEGYEGIVASGRSAQAIAAVDSFLSDLRGLAEELDRRHLFDDPTEILVSAGGSTYFDRVVHRLAGRQWSLERPVRVVLRSGSYVAHAAGRFDESAALGSLHHASSTGEFRQALEIWGMVLSRPEPTLAILGLGKRDVAYDDGLPIPFEVRPRSGGRLVVGEEASILTLNDQHARVGVPAELAVGPGDLMGFHITHPCTTFDKWRLLPVVDDSYRVVDAVATYF